MANFLSFIKAERIPRVEEKYRTAPYRVFVGHSFGGITEHFARASAALGYRIDPPEPIVNTVGNFALGRDSTVALELFELNASLYPNSANADVALGNYWLAKKDSTKSLGHFEHTLALRPGHQPAHEMVGRLKGEAQGSCAVVVWFVRPLGRASFGPCAVWALRCSGSALFGSSRRLPSGNLSQ